MNACSIQPSECIGFALRDIYDRCGYARYKMNKFEEYDLYAKNKDFLISDGVITFTDTNGRLMALKPDVTLSIVKNTKDIPGTVQKLYYNENVYRVSKGEKSFKEIMQVGLEAIGDIDDYCIYEVLKLAAESLECTEKNCILEVSHLGLLDDVLKFAGVPVGERNRVLKCVGEKNLHELSSILRLLNIPDEKAEILIKAVSVYGSPDEALPEIKSLLKNVADDNTLAEFSKVITALKKDREDKLRIDLSLVSDLRYYNGFVFKGFAEGIPSYVLSGGQYDAMMRKMGRKSGAIGFAVYLDMLEQYGGRTAEFDVDNLIIYDDSSDIEFLDAQTRTLSENGESVLLQRSIPPELKYRRLIKTEGCEVKAIEDNA